MLAIYYGCGLRRNEGVCLNVGDINFDRALVHVRKGKNYKERFVPISKASLKYLQDYIYDYRPELLHGSKAEALFLGYYGKRMGGQSLLLRLKYLQQQTENLDLIEKEIGLHTLRHSIATHLLQAGMKLEYIARFLGHGSLESTQIYTHLAGVEADQPQEFKNVRFSKVQLHEDEY
jgi:integrase/recombinase XerD